MSDIQTPVEPQAPTPMTKNDKIVLSIGSLVVVGFAGVIAFFAHKAEKEIAEEAEAHRKAVEQERIDQERWLEQKRNEGCIIVRGADRSYMAIPAEDYTKISFRKPRTIY